MTRKTDTDLPRSGDFLRRQMRIVDRFAYFDHAAVAPIPIPTQAAMSNYIEQVANQGDTGWGDWAMGVEIGRIRAADLLGCDVEEIAFIPNTTFGINVVASGVPWQPGDNIVVPDNEFPSNLIPWRLLARRDVEVRLVPIDGHRHIDRLLDFVDARTRIVSISWVDYLSGYRIDLAELCERVHERGAKLFVDAIQGLGAFPLSVAEIPIDFLAADGHKWMLGPEGAGLMFIRKSHLEWLEPIMMGWGSLKQAHQFSPEQTELKNQASRYEGGSANMAGLLGFSASLALLLEAGCHRSNSGFGATIIETAGYLEEGLRSIGAKIDRDPNPLRQSGIVSFEFTGQDSHRIRQRLLDQNIVVSVRHGRLRAAVHAYNAYHEVDRLLSTLAEALAASERQQA